jgi:hypothetical protein
MLTNLFSLDVYNDDEELGSALQETAPGTVIGRLFLLVLVGMLAFHPSFCVFQRW